MTCKYYMSTFTSLKDDMQHLLRSSWFPHSSQTVNAVTNGQPASLCVLCYIQDLFLLSKHHSSLEYKIHLWVLTQNSLYSKTCLFSAQESLPPDSVRVLISGYSLFWVFLVFMWVIFKFSDFFFLLTSKPCAGKCTDCAELLLSVTEGV